MSRIVPESRNFPEWSSNTTSYILHPTPEECQTHKYQENTEIKSYSAEISPSHTPKEKRKQPSVQVLVLVTKQGSAHGVSCFHAEILHSICKHRITCNSNIPFPQKCKLEKHANNIIT